jgi:glycosyltransferase involved in cell wall biosynthesis
LLTALAYGKCTLVSDIPENLETVGDAGFSFRHGNVEDLKSKLQLLLLRPEMVDDIRLKVLNRVATVYNWDTITKQIVSIYTNN